MDSRDFHTAISEHVRQLVSLAKGTPGRFILAAQHPDEPYPQAAHIPVGQGCFDKLTRMVLDFAREFPVREDWRVRLVPAIIKIKDEHPPADIRDGWGKNQLPRNSATSRAFYEVARSLNRLLAEGVR